MLCAGRVIAGLCVGIASSIVPVYQSEIAPKEIRGRIVSLQQWAITWGILIQYFIQYGAAQVGGGPNDPNQPESAFRIPWGIQMIPAFILLIGLFFFPYSPRWLASQDRWEEAIKVLASLHGGGDVNHPKVLAEYQEIEDALRFEREEALSSFKALTQPRIFKRVLLGMSIQMWSQLCGRSRNMVILELTTYARYRNEHYDVLYRLHHEGRRHWRRALDFCYSVHYQRCHDSAGNSLP
jgi:MFS family permease